MRSTIILLALLVVFIHAALAEKKDKSNKQVAEQKKEASSMFEHFMKLQKERRERFRAHAAKKTDGAAKKPSKRQIWFGGNGDNSRRNPAKKLSERARLINITW